MAQTSHGVYQLAEHFRFGGLIRGFKAIKQGEDKLGLIIGCLVFLVWMGEDKAGFAGFGHSFGVGTGSGLSDEFDLTTDSGDGAGRSRAERLEDVGFSTIGIFQTSISKYCDLTRMFTPVKKASIL